MGAIEWTGRTWNPVRGCRKISPGCKHCYAERMSTRLRRIPESGYERGFDPRLVPEALLRPFQWTQRQFVFVCSMSDLFQDVVPDAYIRLVWSVMRRTPWITYQVLTKRAERMRRLVRSFEHFVPPNVWLGVSVEDRRYGLPRVDSLRWTPAAVRFLSCEPLLEPLVSPPFSNAPGLDLRHIHWVIAGGESGPGARPMQPQWPSEIRDVCRRKGVAFFFKQWGGVSKKAVGRQLDGRTWDERPAPHIAPVATRAERATLRAELLGAATLQGFPINERR